MALKLLPQRVRERPAFVQRLLKELIVGRRISHPNVCRLYDLGVHQELRFITMEYVEGRTLEELIREAAVPQAQVHQILEQLARALAAAHLEQVVHRDLKPGNIMIDGAGRLKVMDFGLARDMLQESSHVGVAGTPMYWAPEQSRGESAGAPADVFAFGVIATMLLAAGLHPGNPESRSLVPPAYREFVTRCLKPRPDDRYPDGQALLRALLEIGGRAPTSVARPIARHGRGWLWISAIAVIGAAGGATWWLTSPRHEALAPDAEPVAAAVVPPPDARAPQPPDASADAQVAVAAPPPDASPVDAAPTLTTPPAQPTNRRPPRDPGRPPTPTPTPKSSPDAGVVTAPPRPDVVQPPTPADDPALAQARGKLDAVVAQRRVRGLLADDIPDYATTFARAREALASKRGDAALAAFAELERLVGKVKIDEAFIDRKLQRLNPQLGKVPLAKQQAILAAWKSGRLTEANRLLNELAGGWR